MRADVKSELQMLRELVWFLLAARPEDPSPISCVFCYKPILFLPEGMTFGHRRHPKVNEDITIHHQDENRENNTFGNLRLCHSSCHKCYHNAKRAVLRKEVTSRVEREGIS